jgi:hypothetical protein
MSYFSPEGRQRREDHLRRQYADRPEILEKKLKDLRKIWYESDRQRLQKSTNHETQPQ